MNPITTILLKCAECAKPLLKKVIPQGMLTDTKQKVLEKSYEALAQKGKKSFDRSKKPDGINIIGLVRAQMGLGQSCRLLANTLEHSSLSYDLYDFALNSAMMSANDHSFDRKISQELKYNINLIHINPDEMLLLYTRMAPSSWDYSYNIAFWLWELEEIPENWKRYFPMLDEIWTPSEFISKSLRKMTSLPVKTMPYWVTAKVNKAYNRAFFKLPQDMFLFLTMYDSNSTMERKNPMGAVKAFKKAFTPQDPVGLVVKVNNARPEDMEILKNALKDYPHVFYITETLEKDQVNSLISVCNVFVSLHRAEGFGLVMAEAMLNGRPVIATNWSSNTEFMNENVACMVDYSFTTLQSDCPPYKKGARWADPNIDQAADYMKKLYTDENYYHQLSENGQNYISGKLGKEQAVSKIEQRVKEIYDGRK